MAAGISFFLGLFLIFFFFLVCFFLFFSFRATECQTSLDFLQESSAFAALMLLLSFLTEMKEEEKKTNQNPKPKPKP